MAEVSYFWDGVATGDAAEAPYSSAEFADLYALMFLSAPTTGGPIKGYLNELLVSGASSPLAVATGAALVNGRPYKNTVATTIVVPTPAASTRIDLIVLQADIAAQTIRLARHAGVEGGGAPALTQTAAVWEIPLAQASITTGGVITLTDRRAFAVTPLAGVYLSSKLAADDTGHTANDWNDLGSGVNVTLTPGTWLVSGQINMQPNAALADYLYQARLYTTSGAVTWAQGIGIYPNGVLSGTGGLTITIAPTVITVAANTVVALQFYADNANDVVLGDATTMLTGMVALRVA